MKFQDSSQPIGLYCHVPFCASTCDFCAFYQEKPRRGDLDRYLLAMDLEFAQLPRNRVVDTIFWGGARLVADLSHKSRKDRVGLVHSIRLEA